MSADLDDLYLTWLYEQTGLPRRGRTRTYFKLTRHMHSKEFVWMSLNDQSRENDGKDLRWEFVQRAGLHRVPAEWMYRPCSVLEMIVGLTRRLATLTDSKPPVWFAQILYNLRFTERYDAYYDGYIESVDETLERLVWRTYEPNGEGGLFPLRHPVSDQRKLDIWYQMNAWLIERDRSG